MQHEVTVEMTIRFKLRRLNRDEIAEELDLEELTKEEFEELSEEEQQDYNEEREILTAANEPILDEDIATYVRHIQDAVFDEDTHRDLHGKFVALVDVRKVDG